MKKLQLHHFDSIQCRKEWYEFDNLLRTKTILKEREDVLPFFKERIDLSLFIGSYSAKIQNFDVIAHEFTIYGDFIADLIVGDSQNHQYLLIEFEDGKPDSIFTKKKKSTSEWSKRYEGAFSQLIDWIWKLEDMRSTSDFQHTFGSRDARFHGLIVIGKDVKLDANEANRLKWRENKVMVDSTPISCVTFNQLSEDIDFRLKIRGN
jgi:hypothetical protein